MTGVAGPASAAGRRAPRVFYGDPKAAERSAAAKKAAETRAMVRGLTSAFSGMGISSSVAPVGGGGSMMPASASAPVPKAPFSFAKPTFGGPVASGGAGKFMEMEGGYRRSHRSNRKHRKSSKKSRRHHRSAKKAHHRSAKKAHRKTAKGRRHH